MKSIDLSKISKFFDVNNRETYWREQWNKLKVHSRKKNNERKDNFVIDSPPPTVSGSLHIGHIFSYTHQDLIARYKRMRGYNVVYPMGWDDNGLPTERRVQNYFGVRAEPNIPYIENLDVEKEKERLGIKKKHQLIISRQNFIEMCSLVTMQDEQAFKEVFERMGYSIDWSDLYTTIDDKSRRIAQRSFLDLFQKKHIYQVESPTMWDVDYQTAVAQAEVEDREKAGAYHDIEFIVDKTDNESFIISTTRPELLAACVGVTAHPDDVRYKHLFGESAITPAFFSKVPIFSSTEVDPEKGTGILMVCTFGDQTDVQWWKDYSLKLRQIIGKNGRIIYREFGAEGWESKNPSLANKNYSLIIGKRTPTVKKIMVEILSDKQNSVLGDTIPLVKNPREISHQVRYYEKGDNPLEYLTTRQWFVRLLDKKNDLIDAGKSISWHPSFMYKRFENWTNNLNSDWCISRQRYFGVPIPVWYPLDNKNLPNYNNPILPNEDELPIDPQISTPSGYNESQRNMPGGFIAEVDVFDTWFTSSLSPQIVTKWGDNEDETHDLFPMDIRPQSHEIIRTWAFYTIVKALLHNSNIPWRNIVISGWVLDPDRKKMSKSKGNVVTPIESIDKFGSDSVRYWAASFRLGADAANDESIFKVGSKLVNKIFNASKFVLSHSTKGEKITNDLDKSFLFELNKTYEIATKAYEEFEFSIALQEIEKFFWNSFTDNYIEIVKLRARNVNNESEQSSAILTLRITLNIILRMFSPFLPTITDEVWSWVFAEETDSESIHLYHWPKSKEIEKYTNTKFNELFPTACKIIGLVRKAKSEKGLSLNSTLDKLTIITNSNNRKNIELFIEDLKNCSGAKLVEFQNVNNENIEVKIV
ncbi:MAG: valine--tRNA ligase [Chloroflexi bacterium]|nr:valine--tRNA ligase [Chloroflexota bacterium]